MLTLIITKKIKFKIKDTGFSQRERKNIRTDKNLRRHYHIYRRKLANELNRIFIRQDRDVLYRHKIIDKKAATEALGTENQQVKYEEIPTQHEMINPRTN